MGMEEIDHEMLVKVYPNPCADRADIICNMANPGHVKVMVYNHLGQLIEVLADEYLPAGEMHLTWNAGKFPPGIYYLNLQSHGEVTVKKILH